MTAQIGVPGRSGSKARALEEAVTTRKQGALPVILLESAAWGTSTVHDRACWAVSRRPSEPTARPESP